MKYIILSFALLVVIASCTDVLSPDISNDKITHISPINDAILSSGNITFKWSAVDFADSVHFLLVSPNFIDPEFTCADTFLTSNTITLQLPTDQYEWQTVGYNDAFTTQSTISSFEVVLDQTLWLSNDPVVLLQPEEGYRTNQDSVEFAIMPLAGAEEYEIVIKDVAGNVIVSNVIDQTMVKFAIESEGGYTWQVDARNNQTMTSAMTSMTRSFTIDRTGPVAPIFAAPIAADTLALSDSTPHISWNSHDAESAMISILLEEYAMDTLYHSITTEDEVNLLSTLLDTFSMIPVKVEAILYTMDGLGNLSDSTSINFEIKK